MANGERERRVTLREDVWGPDRRHLWAVVTASGDLVIEGQDLGPEVERLFGEGKIEYEWTVRVRAPDVPGAVVALSGAPGDDVLGLLAMRF